MLPFITHRKTLIVNRDTYELFNSINDLDPHDVLSKINSYDLNASFEDSAPLIWKFERNNNGGFGYGNMEAVLLAKFENVSYNKTQIDLQLRNRLIFIPVIITLLSYFGRLIQGNLRASETVISILIIGFFAWLDIHKKSILLRRFEEFIHSC